MENTNFNPINVIEEMIEKTKHKYSDNGYMFLLWGWLVFTSALAHFLIMKFSEYPYPFITWAILMPLGGVMSMIYAKKEDKKAYAKTYTDDVMKYTWIAFGITLAAILFNMGKLMQYTYPMVMIAYGVPTFISGGVFKFKPLVYGGLASFALGLISFYLTFDVQLLMLAIAVLLAYIIPGHILKSNYQSTKSN